MNKLNPFAIASALAMLAATTSTGAQAAPVAFDNFSASSYTVDIADHSYTAVFRADVTQTIGGIGARVATANGGNLKFVLIDLGTTPLASGGTVIFTQTKNFAASPAFSYLESDAFSQTLAAGEWYAVGAIAEAGSDFRISYDDAGSVNPGAGFTALANQNINFSNYANPGQFQSGFGCCNIHYQLYGTEAAVPEPTTLALVGLGFAGFALRRRSAVVA